MKAHVAWLGLAATLACGDDIASADDGDESGTGTSGETTGETGTTETTQTETSDSEGETGDLEPCGNGELDPEEECDDGNDVDDDGCSNACVSACGAEFAVNLVLPAEGEFFAVFGMQPGADDGITLLGGVTAPGVGRLRVASFVENQLTGAVEGPPLGPPGDMNAPQRHDATHVRAAPDGDVFALGTSVDPSADPSQTWWLARHAPDLSEIWRIDVGVDPDFAPRGLAVLDDGDPVIVQGVFLADNDTDVLVRRFSVGDGSESWASAHSGEFDAGWSLDEATGLASGAGDRLWASGLLRVDYQTHDTTLLEIDAADGSIASTLVPHHDPGGNHRQRPTDLAVGPDGQVALALDVYGPASKFSYSRAYLYEDGELAWELTREQLPWEDGDPHLDVRVAIGDDGNVLVSGTYTHQFGFGTAARVWVVELDPQGQMVCYARIGEGNNGAVVPRNGFFGSGRAAINLDSFGPGGMGPGSGNNWLLGLRR